MLGDKKKRKVDDLSRKQLRQNIQRLKAKDTLTAKQEKRLDKLQTSYQARRNITPPLPNLDPITQTPVVPLQPGWYNGSYWDGASWVTAPTTPAITVPATGGGGGWSGDYWGGNEYSGGGGGDGGEYGFAPPASGAIPAIDPSTGLPVTTTGGGSGTRSIMIGAAVIAGLWLLSKRKKRSA